MNKRAENFSDIELVIDRFEGDKAVLLFDDEELLLPKKILPKGTSAGDCLVVALKTKEESRREKEKRAKDILNEILRVS